MFSLQAIWKAFAEMSGAYVQFLLLYFIGSYYGLVLGDGFGQIYAVLFFHLSVFGLFMG